MTCLPNTPILRDHSHKEWTVFWGAGQIISLAKEAVKSNQIAFMYAHVFDTDEVKKLLNIIG